ncbi:MAG: DUF721 domain-containing protein [Bacteroidales bacterium]|jgi:hypothetical protein|nr:DUF721 domain-containing protein [Bacteroidales bacterium]HOM36482.1 DUF721 domain-containing protein [Bacteroidales bacterium]HPD23993.1 DUF721 domain-containing protein [Bacteroidales bacterium]HRT80139.1 DUF721 domain-containing protein [Bacteroidales bacterium]
MRRSQTLKLSEILKMTFTSPKLADGLDMVRAKNLWTEICGQHVACVTEDILVKNNIIYVKINSSIIKTEILMIKAEIIKRINQELGRDFIKDIILR